MLSDIMCPKCEPIKRKNGQIIGVRLEITERNYSGTSIDIADCPNCNRIFSISYKVDEILHLKDFGGNDDD
jgi:hypothetical protein